MHACLHACMLACKCMVHCALCNVRVTSTAALRQAVKANLIISFLFFTFVAKQSRQMPLLLADARKFGKSKMNLHSEASIHMTATDKRSLQISLPQIFSVSQSKFAIRILGFVFVLVLIVCCSWVSFLVFRCLSFEKRQPWHTKWATENGERRKKRKNTDHSTLVIG